MRKKTTPFLLLVAAMLLTLPVQAQDFSKKQGPSKVLKAHKAPTLKKADTPKTRENVPEGIPFRKAQQASTPTLPSKSESKLPLNKRQAINPLWTFTPIATSQPSKLPAATGEEKDEHGIIVTPAEGVRKVYTRSGKAYNYTSAGVEIINQSGSVNIVECEDGTVYIRDIVSTLGTGTWVKGTKSGNTITVPAKQPVTYSSNYATTLSVRWAAVDGNSVSAADGTAPDFTFTIDGNTISLEGTSEDLFMAVMWDDDDSFSGYGDYESVWTYSHDYVPLEIVTVTPPEDLVTESWYTKGHLVVNNDLQSFKGNITIGFEGQDVYIKGIFSEFPDAWIKGTIDNGTVTFSGLQYQGTYKTSAGDYDIYAVGTDGNDLADFTMTFDAENKVLTSTNYLLGNASTEAIYYLDWIYDIVIQVEDPSKPIEQLPYTNGFETIDEQEQFYIIDYNGDGSTWSFSNGEARYRYNSNNEADDWLISPAIKLEEGKRYRFALDAHANLYPERVEVLMGKAADPNAMTQTVIDVTDVTWNESQTLMNEMVSVGKTDYYYFGIHAISDADENVLAVDNLLIEEVFLNAPTNVTDLTIVPGDNVLEATISFTAPTQTIGGDNLTSNITKVEILRDAQVIKTFEDVAPGANLTYVDADPTLTAGKHSYQVIPYNEAGIGKKSEIIEVFLTAIVEVPYIADFTNMETINGFVCIDNNEDEYTWKWDETNHAFYRYSSDNSADDYLISPPIHMEAGKNYDITVNAGSAGYVERFEVLIGKEPTVAALTTTVIEPVELKTEEDEPFTGKFTSTEEGAYYVAIHAISDADQYILSIHKLTVEQGASDTAPAAPELTVTPAAEGALSAAIVVVAPTEAVNGSALTGNLEKVEIYRDGVLLYQVEDVAPGATITYTDETVNGGQHTYYAMAYNADGFGLKSTKANVYIGVDTPADVKDFLASDKLTSVMMTWNKVGQVGKNGGYVDPSAVDYMVYGTHYEDTWFGPMLVLDDDPLATLHDADSYEVSYNTEEGEQDYAVWGLMAKNEIGETGVVSASLLVGKPYDLPLIEGFTGSSLHYFWDSNADLLVSSEATDGDGVALAMLSSTPGETYFTSGKVNLQNANNPTLIFDALGYDISSVSIVGSVDGGPFEEIGTADLTEDYNTYKVSLSSIKNGSYAMIGFVVNIVNPTEMDYWTGEIVTMGDALLLDNIRIVDLYENDLSINVSAPASVQASKTAAITATVKNNGERAAKDFTVIIKAGEQELLKEVVNEELASNKTKTFATELSTSIFDETSNITIQALVEDQNDQNANNNVAETTITVKESKVVGPSDLVAEYKGGIGVELSWTAPSSSPTEQTEDFEDTEVFPTFDLGGITATNHYGTFGNWSLYDPTGSEVYTWGSGAGAVYDNVNEPCAWQVFDAEKAGFDAGIYDAHSGSQFLMSMCTIPNDNGVASPTDHWLISPEMPGMAQTIKFQVRGITDLYGAETFEVLASSTDNKPESFTKISDFATTETEWTEYSVDLPAGTTYFAIRHTSTDIFGLFVDDISFTAGSSEVASFNIYYERTLIATVAGDVTTYTVDMDKISEGEHTFGVSAVYANGQESKPATAEVVVTSSISQILANGQPVDVYTIDGKLVRKQAKTLDGLRGVYVINGKNVMLK